MTLQERKLKEFLRRNNKYNAHLYENDKVEGVDYVICPVSQVRMTMITKAYIKSTLGMTVEEYDSKYPDVKKCSDARKKNISAGVNQVDPETGLTKHKVARIKAIETLKAVDENGVSGYQKLGQKTRATHMSKVDEFGRNGYSQLASAAIVKGNATKVERGLILDPSLRNEFYRYKLIVLYLTQKHKKEMTDGYITGLAGTHGGYQIDHMYSVMSAYKNKVSPIAVSHRNNLEMLPWKENLVKHASSSISLEELLTISEYTMEQSSEEFHYFMDLIKHDMEANTPPSGAALMEKYYESTLYKKRQL